MTNETELTKEHRYFISLFFTAVVIGMAFDAYEKNKEKIHKFANNLISKNN
jgi:hypothetical protein